MCVCLLDTEGREYHRWNCYERKSPVTHLVEFALGEVHLGMLLLESARKISYKDIYTYIVVAWHSLLEYVLLLAILTGGQAHFLLALIVHHFLHHAARLSIQIGQFRWFRIDFTR